ncbi:HAMP domain-containing sensor histidine kinase [Methylacidimicrobium sp. B4]|uniref:sensor histidine kinase n=1 Tax=Methylacidimicrobium sp. B4 TaxID=2796139 RepID=UPI001A8F06AB|nr:HAMP domain-containing sensor histidine kinase [Methylacidimicrobium sp. B4]QSR83931.1 sensor histidine kinase [Methylacidimicrobium sp. B4]
MNRRWLTLTAVFGLAFLGVSTIFHWAASAREARFLTTPEHRREMVQWEAAYALAMLSTFLGTALLVATAGRRPLRALRRQLALLDPQNPWQRAHADERDPEIEALVQEINRLLDRVQETLAEVDRASARMAHELKLPLTLARLRMERVVERVDPAITEQIEVELDRLGHHLDRALLLARAEKGGLVLRWERLDVNELLEELLEGFRLLAEADGRTLETRTEPAEADADRTYLKQILYNLVSNALHHGRGPIFLRLRRNPGCVVVTVGNRIKRSGARGSGLGVGKRIVAALVQSHGNMRIAYRSYREWHCTRLTIFPKTLQG